MSFVFDASITLAWCFSDEATSVTDELLSTLKNETAFVPGIWSLEVSNILLSAVRKKRITYAELTQCLGMLAKLNIHVDNETANKAFHEILSLAHSEQLTTYDAAYLELAMRRGIALVSKDMELCKAATQLGVKVISPSEKEKKVKTQ